MERSFFGAVRQIGYAVSDVDSTVALYRRIDGQAHDLKCFEVTLDASNGYRYRGQPSMCRLKIALMTVNGMDFEFIQPLEGQHPCADYLAAHGDGINHLGLYLDDLEPLRSQMLEQGGRVIVEGSFYVSDDRKGVFAYIQPDDSPYPLYELLKM